MTLTIDSQPVDLPRLPGEALRAYLDRVADLLIKQKRSIGSCQIDGQPATLDAEGDALFTKGGALVIESVPLLVSVQANIALHCNALRKMESDCEALVTDSLLVAPPQVAASWRALCESVKKTVRFLQVLNGLLTKEQVDMLVTDKLAKLSSIMMEVSQVLNKGDVVSFSDILEMQLLPWLGGLREFMQAQLAMVETLIEKNGTEQETSS